MCEIIFIPKSTVAQARPSLQNMLGLSKTASENGPVKLIRADSFARAQNDNRVVKLNRTFFYMMRLTKYLNHTFTVCSGKVIRTDAAIPVNIVGTSSISMLTRV